MAEAQVLVARQETVAEFRVVGRATFKVSQHVRECGMRMVRQGLKRLIVDFSECQAMDSTFMGVLVMLGIECRGKCDIVFVNVSDSNRKLLDGLGVSKVFRFAAQPVQDVNWRTLSTAADQAPDMKDMAATMLAAHQALMDIDPENVPKFKSVVEMLAAEVGQIRKEGEAK